MTQTQEDTADVAAALRRYAAAEGTAAANILALHVLAANYDPLLIEALKSLRVPSSGRRARIGDKTAHKICDRLAELTSPNERT